MKSEKGKLISCEKCNKPLIERLPNGLWCFKFGRHKRKLKGEKVESMWNPVFMLIHGSLKIRCFRDDCLHINILNYFPTKKQSNEPDMNLET